MLTQQQYDYTTKMVHNITSPSKRSHSSPNKATGMEYIPGFVEANLFHALVQNGTDGAGHDTQGNNIGTPVTPSTQK